MSFPRYPQYKASGVEWLGDVPDGWSVLSLKRVVNPARQITYGIVQAGPHVPDGVPYIRPADMSAEDGIKAPDEIMRTSDEIAANYTRSTIRVGDIVCSIGPSFGKVMITPAWLDGANLTQGTARIAVQREHNSKYIFWTLRAPASVAQWVSSIGGATFSALNLGPLARTTILIPPLPEQTAIAEFLDRETAKIDGLVAEQRRLMELLKEKRQAVISHAVTKGLNPHAPMKPSGIEWLGDVPSHWKVIPIKWLSPVKRGASPRPIDDPRYFDEEGEYAWVRIADVSACDGVLSETTQRLSPLGSSLSVKILPNELFVSIAGTVGKPCIAAIKACIHDGFVYFPTLKINPWFLYRIFEAGDCYGGLGKWGTQLNLNTDTVGSIRIAIPPADELHHILKFIDDESSRFDTLTAEAQRAIDLLQERRTALISAAVSGQIDVRQNTKN